MLFANFFDEMLGMMCIGVVAAMVIIGYAIKSMAEGAVEVVTAVGQSEVGRVLLDSTVQTLLED